MSEFTRKDSKQLAKAALRLLRQIYFVDSVVHIREEDATLQAIIDVDKAVHKVAPELYEVKGTPS